MRILFVSNFYPPYAIGGMEYRCQEVVDYLHVHGHETLVLTSTYGQGGLSVVENGVRRVFYLEANMVHYQLLHFFTKRQYEDWTNLKILKRFMNSFSPDVIFVWGMWNLSRKIPAFIEHSFPAKVVYSLASDWPAQPDAHEDYWNSSSGRIGRRPLKYLMARIVLPSLQREKRLNRLEFKNVICVSKSLRDSLLVMNVPLQNVQVIHPGIDLECFKFRKNYLGHSNRAKCISLLCAGSLFHQKGVHTAIDAIALILRRRPEIEVNFTVLGSGNPGYEYHLKHMVEKLHLQNFVQFIPQIPRQQIPEFLSKFDALIFPSTWEEPFSRIILEGMATGLVILATNTGGTKEIIIDNLNGLTFDAGDEVGLARCIEKIFDNPGLRSNLTRQARDTVVRQYDIKRMNQEIENYLFRVANS